jgi:hypothetical protein
MDRCVNTSTAIITARKSQERIEQMSIVYVPQQPSRWDADLSLWIPTMNLRPAEKYGTLSIMLPPNLSNAMLAPLVEALKEKMSAFTRNDYLVAIGDPSLIAAAAGIALRHTFGTLKLLKWDRQAKDYICTEIKL